MYNVQKDIEAFFSNVNLGVLNVWGGKSNAVYEILMGWNKGFKVWGW